MIKTYSKPNNSLNTIIIIICTSLIIYFSLLSRFIYMYDYFINNIFWNKSFKLIIIN